MQMRRILAALIADMTTLTPARQPKGQPTGGQFAPSAHDDADISLAPTFEPAAASRGERMIAELGNLDAMSKAEQQATLDSALADLRSLAGSRGLSFDGAVVSSHDLHGEETGNFHGFTIDPDQMSGVSRHSVLTRFAEADGVVTPIISKGSIHRHFGMLVFTSARELERLGLPEKVARRLADRYPVMSDLIDQVTRTESWAYLAEDEEQTQMRLERAITGGMAEVAHAMNAEEDQR